MFGFEGLEVGKARVLEQKSTRGVGELASAPYRPPPSHLPSACLLLSLTSQWVLGLCCPSSDSASFVLSQL